MARLARPAKSGGGAMAKRKLKTKTDWRPLGLDDILNDSILSKTDEANLLKCVESVSPLSDEEKERLLFVVNDRLNLYRAMRPNEENEPKPHDIGFGLDRLSEQLNATLQALESLDHKARMLFESGAGTNTSGTPAAG